MGAEAWVFLLVLSTGVTIVNGSNILVVMAMASKSHKNVFTPLVAKLAEMGHNVTMISPHRPSSVVPNLTEIIPSNLEAVYKEFSISFEGTKQPSLMFFHKTMMRSTEKMVDALYGDEEIQHLLSQKYDLILLDGFLNDFLAAIPYVVKAPFIIVTPTEPMPWILSSLGINPFHDHVPLVLTSMSDRMNLWERTINMLSSTVIFELWYHLSVPLCDSLIAKYYPGIPSVYEIEKNASLVLSNSHYSISHLMPMPPGLIEVGGMHCKPAQSLPQNLEEFVSESGDAGFILLSFGSILRSVDLPLVTRKVFVKVFARLPQRVIWKWEDDDGIPDLSSNVKLVKWIPQQDLLGHSKIRLFITHGGLLSTQETVYHGCPLIGLPVFGDQHLNMRKATSDGYGIQLEWSELTEQALENAIQRVIYDRSYDESVKHRSKIMRDQPQTSLDRAVFWTEYVIRHNGAPHLRSTARDLAPYQRALVDVALVLLLAIVLVGYVVMKIAKFTLIRIKACFRKTEIGGKAKAQ